MRIKTLFLSLLLALPLFAADARPYTRNVAIVLYDGVEILDFAGPTEVFQAAASFGRANGQPAFRVYTVAATAEPLLSQHVVKVQPEFTIDNAPKPDIIVLPGGSTNVLLDNPKFMEWAKRSVAEADIALTVCTGAFVLSRLGVLDGLDVTTYYNAIERLRETTPKARVHDGRRFIDNDKVVTTAGVSAGIDGSLHVVARLLGRIVAEQTAQYMEYRWTPDSYMATKYEIFNPSLDDRGRAIQQANLHLAAKKWSAAIEVYRAVLKQDPSDLRSTYNLARALHESKAYPEAAAAFTKAAELSDLRRPALYNAACAYARAGQRQAALDALKGAIDAGLRGKQNILAEEDFDSLREEPRFKQLVADL